VVLAQDLTPMLVVLQQKHIVKRLKNSLVDPTWSSLPQARVAVPELVQLPLLQRFQKHVGALTIGVVTRPFQFEGRRRAVQADNGIQRLKEKVDTLIVIPNDRLLTVANDKTSLVNAFKMADEILLQGVAGITNSDYDPWSD
jgi:hypothetical protein